MLVSNVLLTESPSPVHLSYVSPTTSHPRYRHGLRGSSFPLPSVGMCGRFTYQRMLTFLIFVYTLVPLAHLSLSSPQSLSVGNGPRPFRHDVSFAVNICDPVPGLRNMLTPLQVNHNRSKGARPWQVLSSQKVFSLGCLFSTTIFSRGFNPLNFIFRNSANSYAAGS